MEELESNDKLFKFHPCQTSELFNGNLKIMHRNNFENIAKKDFIGVCDDTIQMWDGTSIRSCNFLRKNTTWMKMVQITLQAIQTECKTSEQLVDDIDTQMLESQVMFL